MPGAGAAPWLALLAMVAGDVDVDVDVLGDVAALAIAAPPPARAAVTASVVSTGLIDMTAA